jgi:hypothetical protein
LVQAHAVNPPVLGSKQDLLREYFDDDGLAHFADCFTYQFGQLGIRELKNQRRARLDGEVVCQVLYLFPGAFGVFRKVAKPSSHASIPSTGQISVPSLKLRAHQTPSTSSSM